ncbi:LUD domain-containing protein [Candidatus Daviesbacteria bacterium]|nr:LUD domain-containing protein [Candidatus Daviesbacteria bacterium]
MSQWDQLPNKEIVYKTIEALKANGIEAKFVETSKDAKIEVLALIPKGAEVMTMTSVTLDTTSLAAELNESGKYDAVRQKLLKMDYKLEANEMRKMAAAPDWVVGSVHAVTEDGHLLIASNTGSQLATEAYTGGKLIFVVGTQKIVKDTDEGLDRIYQHSLPLEDQRAQKAYGMGSHVGKILIINKEVQPGRITIILVGEKLGF